MIKILGLFPLVGNGGITSWTNKFLESFPNEEFIVTPIDNAPESRTTHSLYSRIVSGFKALKRIKNAVSKAVEKEIPDILHTSTSGSIGSLRDYVVGGICREKGIKSILHCHYGCISDDVNSKGLLGVLVRKAMKQFDQIWVLDSRSYDTLKSIPEFSDKVMLTPNFIHVPEIDQIPPKTYKRVGFIGNLIPSKGIYELVEAATKCDIRLDIIGPGNDEVVSHIKEIAGNKLNESIFIHGRLPNDKAVEFMNQIDIVALPTYYQWEAFPISILEAMSLGKLVLSCPRAAISDMLTDLNGKPCGLLVEPKSSESIVNAITWAQEHRDKADDMCRAAYIKVKECYSTSVVYDLYRENYRKLLKSLLT